ncbi:MAG: AbrB family transcriptional regulator [Bacillota bacterium]|nr:AbrB family transcriptional regulator [Bacillota bacterium]
MTPIMNNINELHKNVPFILISMLGGFILSLTGAPIAWMVGSLILACILYSTPFKWLKENKGLHPIWRQIGQAILGIELGQHVKLTVMSIFEAHYLLIAFMLVSSIAIAILSGIILWRFSNASMATCLFGTTPGGISAMPTIAEEVGANSIIVSIIQTLRILLVVGIVPLVASLYHKPIKKATPFVHQDLFDIHSLAWTAVIVIGAYAGVIIGKKIKMPAPWLVGSMLGTMMIQILGTLLFGNTITPFWPHKLIIISQILIGTSIGSRVHKDMFKGLKRIIIIGLFSSLCLVCLLLLCSIAVARLTHIPLVTCILAFAPGGVAEMATAAIALHADSTFVVAVQSLRLITILILLPPIFRHLNKRVTLM